MLCYFTTGDFSGKQLGAAPSPNCVIPQKEIGNMSVNATATMMGIVCRSKESDYSHSRRSIMSGVNAGGRLLFFALIVSISLISSAVAFNCQPVSCVQPAETICVPVTAYSSCCSPSPLFPPAPPVVAPVIICPVQATFGPPIMCPPPEMISKVKRRNLYANLKPKFSRSTPRIPDQNPAPFLPAVGAPKK
jgi:hypothetical protein